MTGALLDDETMDLAHSSSAFGTRRTPLIALIKRKKAEEAAPALGDCGNELLERPFKN
jgi:hypothetical protein